MNLLDLVKLIVFMGRTSGSPEVKIGLIEGAVVTHHTDLAGEYLRVIPESNGATCNHAICTTCLYGTFVAGILSPKRNSPAPAICSICTPVIRPIFAETTSGSGRMLSSTRNDLAGAIIERIDGAALVKSLSLALVQLSANGEQVLNQNVKALIHGAYTINYYVGFSKLFFMFLIRLLSYGSIEHGGLLARNHSTLLTAELSW